MPARRRRRSGGAEEEEACAESRGQAVVRGACTHVDFFQAPAKPIIPLTNDTTDDISTSAFPVLSGVVSCSEVSAHAHTTWVVQIANIMRWRKSVRAFASNTSAYPRQCE